MMIDGTPIPISQNIPVGGAQTPVPVDMAAKKGAKKKKEPAAPKDSAEIKGAPKEEKGVADVGPTPEVIVMREKGLDTLVDLINESKKSIDVHIYIITANTPKLTEALNDALDRGVKVRLMVEDDPFYWSEFKSNPSDKAVQDLVAKGAEYKPDNPKFSKDRVTHEKSIVFDGEKALILTGNLGSTTFDKNLDLGAIVINNPKVVSQVQTIFESDWNRTPLPELEDVGLVISPDNARSKLEDFMGSAKKSIHVLQQGFSDTDVVALLAQKAKDGVAVDLTLTDPGVAQYNMQSGAFLASKGAKVRFLSAPYIHAKAVSIDSADEDKTDDKTFIGSQNFSFKAIERNRELGIIFSDKNDQLNKIIEQYGSKGFDIPSKMIVTDASVIGRSINSAVRNAEDSVIVETNLFSDKSVKTGLIKAAKNGVKVKVMMPQNPFPWDPNCKFNIDTAKELKEQGVEVKWTDDAYKSMQGTAVVVDGKEAIVFPDNISGAAFSKNVNFGILDINSQEVENVEKKLEADWKGVESKDQAAPGSEIVTSPGDARNQIMNFINEANSSINIETKEITDGNMVKLLKEKAKAGIPVKVLLPDKEKMSAAQKKVIEELQKGGVQVELLGFEATNNNFIEIDREKAYIGAHKLSKESLDNSRGFGVIATHPEMIRISHKSFGEHWVTSAVDHAKKDIHLEKKFIDSADRVLTGLLKGMAKRGVKVTVTAGNFDESAFKMESEGYNKDLRRIAALDPAKDKEEIAKFFGLFYDQDKAVTMQKKLKATIESLKDGEEMIQGAQKDPNTIVRNFLTVDGKEADLVDKAKNETDNGGDAGDGAFGMLTSGSLFTEIFQEPPEEFSDAEELHSYFETMKGEEPER